MTISEDTLRQMISGHPRKKSIASFAWAFAGEHIGWFTSQNGPQAISSAHRIWTYLVETHQGRFLTFSSLADAIANNDGCNEAYNLGVEQKQYVDFMLGVAIDHYNAILADVMDGELVLSASNLLDTEAYSAWRRKISPNQRQCTSIDIKPGEATNYKIRTTELPEIQVQFPNHDETVNEAPSIDEDQQRKCVLEWLSSAYPDAVSGKDKLPKKETVWNRMRVEGIASGYNDAKIKWYAYVPKELRRGRGQRERK